MANTGRNQNPDPVWPQSPGPAPGGPQPGAPLEPSGGSELQALEGVLGRRACVPSWSLRFTRAGLPVPRTLGWRGGLGENEKGGGYLDVRGPEGASSDQARGGRAGAVAETHT